MGSAYIGQWVAAVSRITRCGTPFRGQNLYRMECVLNLEMPKCNVGFPKD